MHSLESHIQEKKSVLSYKGASSASYVDIGNTSIRDEGVIELLKIREYPILFLLGKGYLGD